MIEALNVVLKILMYVALFGISFFLGQFFVLFAMSINHPDLFKELSRRGKERREREKQE